MSGLDNKPKESSRTFAQAIEQACLQSDASAILAIEAELQLSQATTLDALADNQAAVGAAKRAESISNSKAISAMTLEELCLGFMDTLAERTGAGTSLRANQRDAGYQQRARDERYRREERAFEDEVRRAEKARLLLPSAILPAVDFEGDEPVRTKKRAGGGKRR